MYYSRSVRSRQVPCPNGQLYEIRSGDTLYRVAQRFGISISQLIAANPGIQPENLRVGQVICVPVAPQPGPCPGGTPYTIQSGDTFYTIAQRNNVRLEDLLQANPGVNPDNLRVGQQICIPGAVVPPPQPEPQPTITIPCCTVLQSGADISPYQVQASALFTPRRQAPGNVSQVTFVVVGDVGLVKGPENTLVGTVVIERQGAEPLLFPVTLEPSPPEDQNLEGQRERVWVGSRIITETPRPGDSVEVSIVADGQPSLLLRNTLTSCQR